MTPMFGWLSKPNAYHNASTSSSPGSAPGSPATPSPVPQRALQDPLAFKRVATTANRPLEYRGRSNHLEGTQTQRENYPQVERVWSDTDNSPAVVEVSVDNDYGRVDSTPASPSSQRVLWMPPPTQGGAGELPLFVRPSSLPTMRPAIMPPARSNTRAAPTLVGSPYGSPCVAPTADEDFKRRAVTAREAAAVASETRAAALRMAAEADEAEEVLRSALDAVQDENLDALDAVDSLTVGLPTRPPNYEGVDPQAYRQEPAPYMRAAQGWTDRRSQPSTPCLPPCSPPSASTSASASFSHGSTRTADPSSTTHLARTTSPESAKRQADVGASPKTAGVRRLRPPATVPPPPLLPPDPPLTPPGPTLTPLTPPPDPPPDPT